MVLCNNTWWSNEWFVFPCQENYVTELKTVYPWGLCRLVQGRQLVTLSLNLSRMTWTSIFKILFQVRILHVNNTSYVKNSVVLFILTNRQNKWFCYFQFSCSFFITGIQPNGTAGDKGDCENAECQQPTVSLCWLSHCRVCKVILCNLTPYWCCWVENQPSPLWKIFKSYNE